MTFVVQAFSTSIEEIDTIKDLFTHLDDSGYKPLIAHARQRFFSTFDENIAMETQINQMKITYDDDLPAETIKSYLRDREFVLQRGGSKIAGDIFFSPSGEGILFILIYGDRAKRLEGKIKVHSILEIGYLGNSNYSKCLIDFRTSVTEIISGNKQSIQWKSSQPSNVHFDELQKSEKTRFVTADAFSEKDIEFAEWLEDPSVRQVAIDIKSAGGGMLVEELSKNLEPRELTQITEQLIKTNLIVREYAIICQKTSKQISRVQSLEAIDKAAELGFVCSCGRPFSEENIKELYRPTSELKKMLDKSYWITARLVSVLRKLGVPNNHILLNLEEGPNEIDAALNIDGRFLW